MPFCLRKGISICLLLVCWMQASQAQTLPLAWVRTTDGPRDDHGWDVAADDDGNCFSVGYFSSSATCGGKSLQSAGDADGYLVKYDSKGNTIWVAQAGGPDHDEARGVALDPSGNIYLAGHFGGVAHFGGQSIESAGKKDVFLARYDSSGRPVWTRRAGGIGDDIATGVATDRQGNVFVTGSFSGDAAFGNFSLTSAGRSDIFLAKYTPAGEVAWVRRAGGPGLDEAERVRVDRAGNIYLTGSYTTNAVFETVAPACLGSSDVFTAKYSPEGSLVWLRTAGGHDTDTGEDIAVDRDLNVYSTGVIGGPANFGVKDVSGGGGMYLAKYSSEGELIRVQAFGGDGADQANAVAVDSMGDVYLTGLYFGAAIFGQTSYFANAHADFIVIKLHADGRLAWTSAARGTAYSNGKGLAVNGRGEIYAAGYYRGPTQFGRFSLANLGDRAGFVARINPLPRLEILNANDATIVRWPASDTGFRLEQQTNAAQTSGWVAAPGVPKTVGEFQVLTNTLTAARQFYRLRQ